MYQNSLFLHLKGGGSLCMMSFSEGVKVIVTKHDAGARGGKKCPK